MEALFTLLDKLPPLNLSEIQSFEEKVIEKAKELATNTPKKEV